MNVNVKGFAFGCLHDLARGVSSGLGEGDTISTFLLRRMVRVSILYPQLVGAPRTTLSLCWLTKRLEHKLQLIVKQLAVSMQELSRAMHNALC